MTDDVSQWSRDNRDLLIKLSTQLESLTRDVKEMKDNTQQRLALVEQGKLDRTEANRLQAEALDVHADHEGRLRFLERYGAMALGALAVLEFVLYYFKPFSRVTIQ